MTIKYMDRNGKVQTKKQWVEEGRQFYKDLGCDKSLGLSFNFDDDKIWKKVFKVWGLYREGTPKPVVVRKPHTYGRTMYKEHFSYYEGQPKYVGDNVK